MTNEEKAAIVARVAGTVQNEEEAASFADEIAECALDAAGFFDLLEAAEGGSGCCECPASVKLRAAIRRCKDGGK